MLLTEGVVSAGVVTVLEGVVGSGPGSASVVLLDSVVELDDEPSSGERLELLGVAAVSVSSVLVDTVEDVCSVSPLDGADGEDPSLDDDDGIKLELDDDIV